MPTYEYVCKDCNKTFSVVATITGHEKGPKPACPHCGSSNVGQYFSAFSVITSKKS